MVPKKFFGLKKSIIPKISSLTSKERRIGKKEDEDKVESLKNWEERSIINLLNCKEVINKYMREEM